MFFSLPHRPVNDLAAALGCRLDRKGYVVIDREGTTSVDGVFAAGDVTPGRQLIQWRRRRGRWPASPARDRCPGIRRPSRSRVASGRMRCPGRRGSDSESLWLVRTKRHRLHATPHTDRGSAR